jgi:hypothetical protein
MPVAQSNFGLPNVFGQVSGGVFTRVEGNDESAAALVTELAELTAAAERDDELVAEAA